MGKKALQPSGMCATAKAMRTFTPWLFDLLKMRTFPGEVNDFFTRVVRDTMDQRVHAGYQRNDFLQLMMQLRQQSGEKEDFGEFRFVFVFLFSRCALGEPFTIGAPNLYD